ncbi:DUF4179 domain-containing protein [Clostridium nigeriense]|uniref:DUF4179 domain-containing protein n=1 Tax=Clostridium nigeriense TaxID=1805470 RepID=UPI00082E9995|nr:DUF4179 domain-containing protein [Clostridium nigeriense]
MKDLFNKEKIIYKNIEIPEDLDFLVAKSIIEGNKKNSRLVLISKIVAASFIAFIITLNLFPKFSIVAQNLPIIGKLAQLLTRDKGFNNAVEADLIQNIDYKNEVNGIKLKVSNVVGDYKAMWIEYEVEEGYKVEVDLTDINEQDKIEGLFSQSIEAFGRSGNYIECNFEKFEQEFLVIFNVYNKDESESLAVFKVPIILEEKFRKNINDIPISNNIIRTEIGDIKVKSINSSKTRTSLIFNLNSDEYNFVSFDNPVLIDNKGNEYKSSRVTSYLNGDKRIDFEGEIKDKDIIFKCDNIFYDKKYDKKIIVDLKNKLIQDNEYNTTFESYENNILKLKTENVEGINFINKTEKYTFNRQEIHTLEVSKNRYKAYEIITSFNIIDEDDGILELEIDSITKDKVKGFKFEIN